MVVAPTNVIHGVNDVTVEVPGSVFPAACIHSNLALRAPKHSNAMAFVYVTLPINTIDGPRDKLSTSTPSTTPCNDNITTHSQDRDCQRKGNPYPRPYSVCIPRKLSSARVYQLNIFYFNATNPKPNFFGIDKKSTCSMAATMSEVLPYPCRSKALYTAMLQPTRTAQSKKRIRPCHECLLTEALARRVANA
jgi:hypothetical protein